MMNEEVVVVKEFCSMRDGYVELVGVERMSFDRFLECICKLIDEDLGVGKCEECGEVIYDCFEGLENRLSKVEFVEDVKKVLNERGKIVVIVEEEENWIVYRNGNVREGEVISDE